MANAEQTKMKVGRPTQPILLVEGEGIQWHRATTAHDRCPRCGAAVGNLGRRTRCCLGTCEGGGLTTTLKVEPKVWLHSLGFNEAEIAALMKKAQGQGKRRVRYVSPGFLGREA